MTCELIDSHTHLTYEGLADQLPEVLARAREVGVGRMICVGTNEAECAKALMIAQTYEPVFAAMGIHAHEADRWQDVETIRRYVVDQAGRVRRKVVAVGETGLDYHYSFAGRENQQRLFVSHLRLARAVGLPVIVHTREAFDDTLAILEAEGAGLKVVIHCFTESLANARRAVAWGAYVSLSGVVTFKNSAALREVAKDLPADRLLVETDCPFLSPEPVRKCRVNEPANVAYVAAAVAAARGVSVEKLLEQTTRNAVELFGL